MPLNKACLGKQYSSSTTAVTFDAIRGYARSYDDDNPRYFEAGTPGGIVAPPMFAVVVTWMPVIAAMTDPDLHADLLRLLHSAQDMEFAALMRPGDVITATAKITSIETVSNGETMALALEAKNQHGTIVNRTAFAVLIRGRRDAHLAADKASQAATARGELVLSVAQTIDRDQTFRYAAASGDRNPIHVDENVAKMAGLPGIIVHGLCTMAFTAKVMVDNLCARDPAHLRRLAVHFSRPVFPGDRIATKVWPSGSRDARQIFSYETYNADDLPVIRNGIAEISS